MKLGEDQQCLKGSRRRIGSPKIVLSFKKRPTFYLSTQPCSGPSEFQIFGHFVDERGFDLILFPKVSLQKGIVADGIDEAGDAFGIVANE
jgi:hypothetical protein